MALIRVKFADDDGGTNEYIVDYNPIDIDVPTSEDPWTTVHPIVDGSSVRVTGVNNYTYKLIWKGWDHSSISSMLSTLESYVYAPASDNTKFIHLGDIGTKLGDFSSYTEVKVISINKTFRPGTEWIYDEIILSFEKVI
ncbi:MAG: hypothetical protein ACXAB7_18870 [Candidatus Kariarchaeaceae archaeon]|jgi:hypothetical protein